MSEPSAAPSIPRKRSASQLSDGPGTRGLKKVKPDQSPVTGKDKKRRKKKKRRTSVVVMSNSEQRTGSPRMREASSSVTPSPAAIESATKVDDNIPSSATVVGPSRSQSQENDEQSQLKSRVDDQAKTIQAQQKTLSQLQQSLTCQVCLDLLHKPFALSPCGHVTCHSCLVNWFKAPPAGESSQAPRQPIARRKKTCPHCRQTVLSRPVEVWAIKEMVASFVRSGMVTGLPSELPVPPDTPANTDPWDGIFPKTRPSGSRGPPMDDAAPEEIGMLDREDGGIYRCIDCMHEIYDGFCSGCDREYPAHHAMVLGDLQNFFANHPHDLDYSSIDGDSDGGNEIDPLMAVLDGFHHHENIDMAENSGSEEEEDYEGSFIDDGEDDSPQPYWHANRRHWRDNAPPLRGAAPSGEIIEIEDDSDEQSEGSRGSAHSSEARRAALHRAVWGDDFADDDEEHSGDEGARRPSPFLPVIRQRRPLYGSGDEEEGTAESDNDDIDYAW